MHPIYICLTVNPYTTSYIHFPNPTALYYTSHAYLTNLMSISYTTHIHLSNPMAVPHISRTHTFLPPIIPIELQNAIAPSHTPYTSHCPHNSIPSPVCAPLTPSPSQPHASWGDPKAFLPGFGKEIWDIFTGFSADEG